LIAAKERKERKGWRLEKTAAFGATNRCEFSMPGMLRATLAKGVSGFSRSRVTDKMRIHAPSTRVSAKRSRFLFAAVRLLKPLTTFASALGETPPLWVVHCAH
jgi:hypothetical protein